VENVEIPFPIRESLVEKIIHVFFFKIVFRFRMKIRFFEFMLKNVDLSGVLSIFAFI